jgi:hypoxia up-regulated 1
LAKIQQVEAEVLEREEARNVLEGFLYRLQRVLDGSDTKALQIHGSEEEKQKLTEGLASAFAWLAEHADTADAASLKKVRTDLE